MSTKAMLEVLEKAANDITFYEKLAAENPEEALKDFDLTPAERVAVTYGDLPFIESRIGRRLDEKLMKKVLIPIVSRERR